MLFSYQVRNKRLRSIFSVNSFCLSWRLVEGEKMLESGGSDHGVPSDVSWPNFVQYTKLLAKATGWL